MLVRTLTVIFIASVAINFAWELAQAPLYEWPGDSRNVWWHCFVASLGDGLMILLVFAAGWLGLGRFDWFVKPGVRGYLVMLVAGLALAVGVEFIAIQVLKRWTYTQSMPRIPGLNIGIVPVIQMLILPPLIFRVAARFCRTSREIEQ
jgi:hypothetical protein